MAWKIEPEFKNSIVDIEYYSKTLKNGKELTLSKEVGYRWGYIIVDDDPREAIEEAQKENKPLDVGQFHEIDHSYEDGCWSDYVGLDELSKKEQRLFSESDWPEDAGWECVESETFFHGDVTVTQVSDSYPYSEISEADEIE